LEALIFRSKSLKLRVIQLPSQLPQQLAVLLAILLFEYWLLVLAESWQLTQEPALTNQLEL
jgi:hypothetical protein